MIDENIIDQAVLYYKYREWSERNLGYYYKKSDAIKKVLKEAESDAHQGSQHAIDTAKEWKEGGISFSNDDVSYNFQVYSIKVH